MAKKLLFIFSVIVFAFVIFTVKGKNQAPESIVKEINKNTQNVYKLSNIFKAPEKTVTSAEVLSARLENHAEIITNTLELSCDMKISNSFSDLDIFKKEQTLTFFANAIFTVNFDEIQEIISYDEKDMIIEIYVNAPVLFDIYIDNEKTVAKDTHNGLLRFGEMNFTSDEYNAVLLHAEEIMRSEALSQKNLRICEENAAQVIKEILGDILVQAGFLGYEIKIIFN